MVKLNNFNRLVGIGKEISRQKDNAKLFRFVVEEAIAILGAEGGTLYLYDKAKNCLTAVVALNQVLNMKHVIEEFKPHDIQGLFSVELKFTNGIYSSIAGECWRRKSTVMVADSDADNEFDLHELKRFDSEHNYKSKTIFAFPLLSREDQVLGVVQLVNPMIETEHSENIDLIATVASFIGLAMDNKLLLLASENLLKSVVEMISAAIDAKSKTTSGHCHRVTELTMMLAHAMAVDTTGPYQDFNPTFEQLAELRTATLLHDVGKIATPDHVMEKAHKLEKKVDRIEFLRLRHEMRQEYLYAQKLTEALHAAKLEVPPRATNKQEEADFHFLESLNIGGEFVDETSLERLHEIARRQTPVGPLIETDDLSDLAVQRGTLNPEERQIMEEHAAISIRLLEKLPWPENLVDVAEIAGKHHENCDGSGYPLGLTGEQMSLRAKILSLTDRFEGLSARDRSYRNPKTLSQVMDIMERMSKHNKIDSQLFEFFVTRGVYLEYAHKFLLDEPLQQADNKQDTKFVPAKHVS